MTTRWKARMPKTPPADGKAHVVFSMKDGKGNRGEVCCEMDRKVAARMLMRFIPTPKAKP